MWISSNRRHNLTVSFPLNPLIEKAVFSTVGKLPYYRIVLTYPLPLLPKFTVPTDRLLILL